MLTSCCGVCGRTHAVKANGVPLGVGGEGVGGVMDGGLHGVQGCNDVLLPVLLHLVPLPSDVLHGTQRIGLRRGGVGRHCVWMDG